LEGFGDDVQNDVIAFCKSKSRMKKVKRGGIAGRPAPDEEAGLAGEGGSAFRS
jgi:hypothetical protein